MFLSNKNYTKDSYLENKHETGDPSLIRSNRVIKFSFSFYIRKPYNLN